MSAATASRAPRTSCRTEHTPDPAASPRLRRWSSLGATAGERDAARAAAERIKARLGRSSPQPISAPILLPDHLARWRGLVRTVEQAPERDRAKILFWAAGRVRDARHAHAIAYPDLVVLREALLRTALKAGLSQWESERQLALAMKQQSRDRR